MNRERKYLMVRTFLSRVREAERKVERLKGWVVNLRTLATNTGGSVTGMPREGEQDQQRILTIIAKIDEIERKIEKAEEEAKDIRMNVGITICRIEDPQAQRVLLLHYLENKSWKDIAVAQQYSIAQIYRFRDKGYADLEEILRSR